MCPLYRTPNYVKYDGWILWIIGRVSVGDMVRGFLYGRRIGGLSIRWVGAKMLLFESDTGRKTSEVNVENSPPYKKVLRFNAPSKIRDKTHSHSSLTNPRMAFLVLGHFANLTLEA